MKNNTLNKLQCVSCKDDLKLHVFEECENEIKNGVLICAKCKRWYPIVDYIPELFPVYLISHKKHNEFRELYKKCIELPQPISVNKKSINEEQIGFYDIDSENYQELVLENAFWKANDRNTIHKWIIELSNNDNVLDIGCGSGRCTVPIAHKVNSVIGIDISSGMLKQARKKAIKEGNISRIDYIQADAENLPFKTGLFDYCNMFGILHHVESIESVINETYRVLNNRGYFNALENNETIFRGIFDLLMKFDKLWNEHAGASPLLKISSIEKIAVKTGFNVQFKTSTFIPPNIFKFMPDKIAFILLKYTDLFMQKIPYLNKQGGQLIIHGYKKY